MYLFKYIINKLDYFFNCIVNMPHFLLYEIFQIILLFIRLCIVILSYYH